jgi:hypothetical protein
MSLRKRSLYGSCLSNICLASGEQKIVDANEFAERPRMWSEWVWDRRWRAGTVSPGEAPNWSTRIGKGGMKPWRGVPRGIDGPPKLRTRSKCNLNGRHCGPVWRTWGGRPGCFDSFPHAYGLTVLHSLYCRYFNFSCICNTWETASQFSNERAPGRLKFTLNQMLKVFGELVESNT